MHIWKNVKRKDFICFVVWQEIQIVYVSVDGRGFKQTGLTSSWLWLVYRLSSVWFCTVDGWTAIGVEEIWDWEEHGAVLLWPGQYMVLDGRLGSGGILKYWKCLKIKWMVPSSIIAWKFYHAVVNCEPQLYSFGFYIS